MPTAMDEAITRLGVPVTEHTLVRTIIDVLAEFPAPGVRDLPSREFTPAEAATLREAGLDLEPRDFGAADPFLRSRVKYATLVAEGWTAAEVAARLGTSVQWVRKQLRDRALLGAKLGDEWRLPRFQFDDDGNPLPGMQRVLPLLDPAKSLVSIYNWFTLPDGDLQADGEAVSPRQWLAEGRDPLVVARQASDL
jgi:hypothetical protein